MTIKLRTEKKKCVLLTLFEEVAIHEPKCSANVFHKIATVCTASGLIVTRECLLLVYKVQGCSDESH